MTSHEIAQILHKTTDPDEIDRLVALFWAAVDAERAS